MEFAVRQSPARTRIAGSIAQILPTRPMVAVRQPRQRREPVTQCISLASSGECCQRRQLQRRQTQPVELTDRARAGQIDLRQLIEQCLRFTQMRGAAGHGRHRLRPALGQYREHLMTQVIARELPVLIRGVFNPAERVRGRIGFQIRTRDIEQGPQQMPFTQRSLARHRRKPPHSGSPH
ncbi:hypothetical protein D3C87_1348500 [compost metagenome]